MLYSLRHHALLTACVVGGDPPNGNPSPCQTIHLGCVEAWRIDEETGAVAAGELGEADLVLTGWGPDADVWWNQPGDNDAGRCFFGGVGVATLDAALNLLASVGDAVTVVQRRWYTGAAHTQQVIPPEFTNFGSSDYLYFSLRTAGAGISPPTVFARPRLDPADLSPPRAVLNSGLFVGPASTPIPIPTAVAPGVPADWPPSTVCRPYLIAVTVMAIAPDRITISVFGHDGVQAFPGVCITTGADGSTVPTDSGSTPITHIDYTTVGGADGENTHDQVTSPPQVPSSGSAIPAASATSAEINAGLDGVAFVGGTPTIFGALTQLTIGGSGQDTVHQAAVWDRALTPSEIAWLGFSLDKLFATLDDPGSQCAESGCTELAGSGTVNPLMEADGTNAITPDTVMPLTFGHRVLANEGPEVRDTRGQDDSINRTVELVWSLIDGRQVERLRQAVSVTRGGALTTRWRAPGDAPGDVCSAARWRVLNASEVQGFKVERNAGGSRARARLVLEEDVS